MINQFYIDYIKAIENPDRVGWNGKVWIAPQYKGYDKNQRGYGIDIVKNDTAKRLTQNRPGQWLTEEEADKLMKEHLQYVYGAAQKHIEGFDNLSDRRKAVLLGMLYRGDSVNKNRHIIDINEPDDNKFFESINNYYKSKGLNERAKNSSNFFNNQTNFQIPMKWEQWEPPIKFKSGGQVRKMQTAAGGPLFPWQKQDDEWVNNWKFRTTPAAKSKVLSGKGVETDKQYTERRKKEATKRTWRSDAADIAHGIGEGVLALHPYTAIPYFGAKVGQDFLNGTYGWHTALNASVPLFHLAPQTVGLREATNVALEDAANAGIQGIKTLWNNGKLIQKDIPRKAENFYRAVNKDAINDAKKYGIIRGRESRVGDNYPFFGRSSEPYHNTKYVIEGTPESADWISTYKYVYSKNPEIVKLSKIPDRDYSKAYDTIIGSPESNGFQRIGAYDNEFLEGYEALPMTNGQLNVSPSSNFAYWKKYPIIGWRKYNFKQGGKMNILEFLKNGSGIHIKKKNRGSFTRWCGGNVTEECIRRGKNSSNPKIRRKATFADNARHFKHKNGGKAFVEGVNVLDSNPKAYKEVKKKYKGGILDTTSTVINESPITQQRLNWLQKLSEFRKQQDQKALEEKYRQLQKDQETADKVNQYTQMGLEFLNNYMQNKATKNSVSDNSHLTSNYTIDNFWKGQPSTSGSNMFNSFNSMNNTSAYFNYSLNQPKI